jgi:major type 1 subunit fimbrin (pilin)
LLSAAGNTAGDTAFSITVGSCTVGLASFTPYFESGATIDPLTGRLKNTGGAGNVQLQLLNSNGTIIDAAKPTLLQNVAATPIVNAGGVGRYAVRYYATGMTTAGTVVSTVTYSMVYI